MKIAILKVNGLILVLAALIVFAGCAVKKEISRPNPNEAIKLFKERSSVIWSGRFLGLEDGAHPISLSLASDGRFYKGIFTYLNSGEKFEMQGNTTTSPNELPALVDPSDLQGEIEFINSQGSLTIRNGDVVKEISSSHPGYFRMKEFFFNKHTGEWVCIFDGTDLLVHYNAEKANVGASMKLKLVQSFKVTNPVENRNPTIAFSGPLGNREKEISVVLQKNGRQKLDICLFDPNKLETLFEAYNARLDPVNYGFVSGLINADDVEMGSISGNYNPDWTELTLNYTTSNGVTDSYKLKSGKILENKRLTKANFYSVADIEFPYSAAAEDLLFNKLMDSLATALLLKHQAIADSVQKSGSNVWAAEQRKEIRTYSYYGVSFLSEKLASIQWTNRSTHLPNQDLAINYSFDGNREIKMEDLFSKGSGYEGFIAQYIMEAVNEKPYATDPYFLKLLENDPFKHFSFTFTGILMHTDFNGIFGKIYVLIPYQELKPFFKIDNPLSDLMNKNN